MDKYKQEIKNTLLEMNDALAKYNIKLELIIVGGSAFILKNLVPRATNDFDYINKANELAVALLIEKGFDVNNRVKMFDYKFGPDYMDDLEEIMETEFLSVKTISTERLMISKLFSNKRIEDFEEATKRGDITIEKFEEIFKEVFPVAIEIEERVFKENIYMIKNLYEEKGWDYENSDIKHLCERKINKLL